MGENITKINQSECYGCSACKNICPVNAIELIENNEGFKMPIVDEKKCTNCGLCSKVCPVINIRKKQNYKQNNYIGFNKDILVRNLSSSGGIFTLLANWILENNGYVCGAKFDEFGLLKHELINDKSNLAALRGSKYLQSEVGFIFRETKAKLNNGFLVLFCGTPCQVNGLLNYLGKDYNNLYTVDIVCHGVPSQKSFNEFLSEKFGTEQKYSSFNFRDKRNGYYYPSFIVNDLEGKEIFCADFSESYLKAFSENLFLRKSCSNCKYTTKARVGDITISDFWNVKTLRPNLNYENGISSFVINSEKGQKLFQAIKDKFGYLEKVRFKEIIQPCFKQPLKTHKNRDLFFSLKNLKFSEKVDICLNNKNVGIINFSDENENYGALFVAYSMRKIIEKLGYNAYNINYIRTPQKTNNINFENFRKKYLNLTTACYSIEDLSNIQNQFSHIVTGGDQVFNGFLPAYTLQFVKNKINAFSYAASLGPQNISYFLEHKREIQSILARFDNIAVRENSAVTILNELGISSKCYIDSVLLLDEKEYDKIIESDPNVKQKNKKYIACMLWDFEDIKKLPFYDELSTEYEFVNVLDENGKKPSFGQLLSLIKNASYTIVNSYHGIIFSILFQKQFVGIRLNDMRDDRIITVFTKLGIKQNRFFFNIEEAQRAIFDEEIDYNSVNKKLAYERVMAIEYLKKALECVPKRKFKNSVFKIYLFKILQLFKIRDGFKKIDVLLFGFLPILKIFPSKKQIKLFNIFKILSIKIKD